MLREKCAGDLSGLPVDLVTTPGENSADQNNLSRVKQVQSALGKWTYMYDKAFSHDNEEFEKLQMRPMWSVGTLLRA